MSLKNGRFYIGSTNNLERRLEEHRKGQSKYLKTLRPVELMLKQEFKDLSEARKVEYKLKRYKSAEIVSRIIKEGKIKFTRE